MAKPILLTDFQDDVISESMNGKRRYMMENNTDGTISLEDVTEYEQVGNSYGAGQINATNEAVNQSLDANKLIKDLDTIGALTEEGYVPDALAVKALTESLVPIDATDMLTVTSGIELQGAIIMGKLLYVKFYVHKAGTTERWVALTLKEGEWATNMSLASNYMNVSNNIANVYAGGNTVEVRLANRSTDVYFGFLALK